MARILLAEDEFLIRLVMAEDLSAAGHDVILAENGDEAVCLAETESNLDVLVTDIQMPGALDGLALAAHIKAWQPRISVVYVTGRPEAAAGIGIVGPNEVLMRKPFDGTELVEVVRQILIRASRQA